jgi:hypothetical protein
MSNLISQHLKCIEKLDDINNQDSNSDKYRDDLNSLILLFKSTLNQIEILDLYSKNEMFEDISTADLRFYLLKMKYPFVIEKIQIGRQTALNYAKQIATDVLNDLTNRGFVEDIQERPTNLRDRKIFEFKRAKELQMRIKALKDTEGDENDRAAIFLQISLEKQNLEQLVHEIDMELEMLSMREKMSELKETHRNDADARLDVSRKDWRLDETKPLLSAEGKVLQPFVITSEFNQRKEISEGVFRQRNLPTMTVEEYIDREIARGNFLQGGGPVSKVEESSDDEEDIYKKREFDNFKDDNPRGWGNRMNKG